MLAILAGSLTTGLIVVVISGLFSTVPVEVRTTILSAIAVVCAAMDWGAFPQFKRTLVGSRQVRQDIFSLGRLRGPAQFGYELGLGFRTTVTAMATYSVALGLLLLGPTLAETLVCASGFGVGRCLPVLGIVLGHGQTDWHRAFHSRSRTIVPTLSTSISLLLLYVAFDKI